MPISGPEAAELREHPHWSRMMLRRRNLFLHLPLAVSAILTMYNMKLSLRRELSSPSADPTFQFPGAPPDPRTDDASRSLSIHHETDPETTGKIDREAIAQNATDTIPLSQEPTQHQQQSIASTIRTPVSPSVSSSSNSTTSGIPATAEANGTKILLYITTHLSDQHVRYFDCCWPRLMEHSRLLPNVDVALFTNKKLEFYDASVAGRLRKLFAKNPSISYRNAPTRIIRALSGLCSFNTALQMGANLAMELAFSEGWFDGYDWVIRINPDVLIRNSTWLLETMTRPGNATDGIFVRCTPSKLHTDFFAFRPGALLAASSSGGSLPFANLVENNHELTATAAFSGILDSGRYELLPDTLAKSRGLCRVRGPRSSVVHDHESCHNADNGTTTPICNALEGWEIS